MACGASPRDSGPKNNRFVSGAQEILSVRICEKYVPQYVPQSCCAAIAAHTYCGTYFSQLRHNIFLGAQILITVLGARIASAGSARPAGTARTSGRLTSSSTWSTTGWRRSRCRIGHRPAHEWLRLRLGLSAIILLAPKSATSDARPLPLIALQAIDFPSFSSDHFPSRSNHH